MTILSDKEIKKYVEEYGMISDFVPRQVREKYGEKVISYGLSSFGYDATLNGNVFLFIDNTEKTEIDPKQDFPLLSRNYLINTEKIYVPANTMLLACTYEYFKIPKNITAICLGKSTYARCGLIVNVTPLEAGWEGQVTLELINPTNVPIRIYPNEGICQFLFLEGKENCETSYSDRSGKYMHQIGVTLPKV